MKLIIPKDVFSGNPTPPRLFLCTTGKKRIGELNAYNVSGTFKWNSYSEITFTIDFKYTDILTGETKINPLFDKAEGLRVVEVENIGFFIIQDPDTNYSDKDSKTLSAFSLEYACASKYLESFVVNTGEVGSIEVTYSPEYYNEEYTIDQPYRMIISATEDPYDPYMDYFIREIDASSDTTEYVQSNQYINAENYTTYIENGLYVKKFQNVRFYWPTKPELSLLHHIFKKIPEWTVDPSDVASNLWKMERSFNEERVSVYDFLMNEVADKFKCVVEWDTINNKVKFYEEADDGINDEDEIPSEFNTDVYISRENLAREINLKYSTDNIKTKLKVIGSSEDMDIRDVNLGQNYLVNLDFYRTGDWMEQDLLDALNRYDKKVEEYSPKYTEAAKGRVTAYNTWNDIMTYIPNDETVIRVGDTFKKLYCTYVPVYENGATEDQINAAKDTAKAALIKKLNLLHVNEDTEANKTDNILLRLGNKNSDSITIRVYYNSTASAYKVKSTLIKSNVESSDETRKIETDYELSEWINGTLTSDKMIPETFGSFTVKLIGTLGSYLCLTKDETVESNVEDYCIVILREKKSQYLAVFNAQNEAGFSNKDFECIASTTPLIDTSKVWLDISGTSSVVKMYNGDEWLDAGVVDAKNYENYARYAENYDKLRNVEKVLAKKEKDADFWLYGYAVSSIRINADEIRQTKNESAFDQAAREYFDTYSVTRSIEGTFDSDTPVWTFTTSYDNDRHKFAVYLQGSTPYIAYAESVGVYLAKMNRYASLVNFENSFTEDQWIRLSPFIREDEFTGEGFVLTGYETEEERTSMCEELAKDASKELKALSRPSIEFSMSMANILALPEFEPIKNQFALGKFIRVGLRFNIVERARLLEVQLNFSDLSDFSATFGNLITSKSQIDLHADLLKQAVQAGKQVAKSAGDWQRAVDKSTRLEREIADGLVDATLEVGKASGQSIELGQNGLRGRKLVDGTTDQYEDEQVDLINNKLVFTSDNWKTSKSAFGKFEIEDENGNKVEHWGMLAEAMVGGYIEGAVLRGGSLKIGKKGGSQFIVNEDGSVQITDASGGDKYASQSTVETLENARRYRIELSYDKSTLFSDINSDCTITCTVYSWEDDVTQKLIDNNVTFAWKRISNSDDSTWNNNHQWNTTHDGLQPNQIKITNDDIPKNAQIECQIQFDDSILKKEGE